MFKRKHWSLVGDDVLICDPAKVCVRDRQLLVVFLLPSFLLLGVNPSISLGHLHGPTINASFTATRAATSSGKETGFIFEKQQCLCSYPSHLCLYNTLAHVSIVDLAIRLVRRSLVHLAWNILAPSLGGDLSVSFKTI